MKKLTSKEKIRRASKIASAVLILYLITPFVTSVIAAVTGFMEGWNEAASEPTSDTTPESFLMEVVYVILVVILLTTIIIAIVSSLQLLMSIRRDESPFTEKNGKKIRTIGISLMLVEPIDVILKLVQDGIVSVDSGITFSAGIVMYCISLVFRYGCELQQESDETI